MQTPQRIIAESTHLLEEPKKVKLQSRVLKKRNHMKPISIYLFIALSPFLCFSQLFPCEESWSTHMKVKASSGLKLRAEPNLESKTLAIIPAESVIPICYTAEINANIDGIQGHWVLTEYKDQKGYVFDGYLEDETTESPFWADCVAEFVNTWEETFFSKAQEYLGLFKKEGKENYEVRPIEFELKYNDKLYKGSKDQEVPIWLFFNAKLPIAGELKGIAMDKHLHLGEKIYMKDAILYASGAVIANEKHPNVPLWYKPYELRARGQKGDKLMDQLIISSRHSPNLGGITLRFIGDLDRDGMDDIIFTYSENWKGWDHIFASSRYAAPDQLYRTFLIGGGSD